MTSQKLALNLFSESATPSGEVRMFSENTATGRQYIIEGVYAQANKLNRNNRIYPDDVLFPDVERYITNYVERRLAWGELDHPEKRVHVDMKNASHLITDMWIEGDNVMGKSVVLDNPIGNMIKSFIDVNGQLAVSTRGLGKSVDEGDHEVMKIYHMTAVDVVSHPSGIDCFVNGVMEGVDYLVEAEMISKSTAFKILHENDKRVSARNFSLVVSSILKEIKA